MSERERESKRVRKLVRESGREGEGRLEGEFQRERERVSEVRERSAAMNIRWIFNKRKREITTENGITLIPINVNSIF